MQPHDKNHVEYGAEYSLLPDSQLTAEQKIKARCFYDFVADVCENEQAHRIIALLMERRFREASNYLDEILVAADEANDAHLTERAAERRWEVTHEMRGEA